MIYACPERPPTTTMLSPATYANGEIEGPFETGALEDNISLELDKEYQSIPSTRFEVTTVS